MRKKRDGIWQYSTIAVLVFYLVMLILNYSQYQLSPLAGETIAAFSITPAQFAGLFSAPMIPAFFLSLFSGILADRVGITKVLGTGLFISTIGLFIRIFSADYNSMMISMLLLGVGLAFFNANTSKFVGCWYKSEKIQSVSAFVLSSSSTGMTIAVLTTTFLPSSRDAYKLSAVLCVVIFIFWIILMKDHKKGIKPPQSVSLRAGLKIVVKNRSIWLAGLCMLCLMGCCVTINSFMPTALSQIRGIDSAGAGFYASLITFGNIFGALIGPRYLRMLKYNFKLALIIASLVFGLGCAFGWLLPVGPIMIAGFLLTGLALGIFFPLLMGLPVLLPDVGPAYAGTGGGLIATLQMFGSFFIPSYIIMPIAGDSYHLAFALAGALMLLSCLFALLFPDLKKVLSEA